MKNFLIITTIFIIGSFNLNAEEREDKLDILFENLKKENVSISYQIEKKIWKIWSTHPYDNKLTELLDKGSSLVNKQDLNEALNIFNKIIDLDPNWAEAWNKRATVLFMLGEFQKSQNDIDKVLKLEERHFGALAGQGLVNIHLENYEKAIMSYKKVQEIYPSKQSPNMMIKRIEKLIKERTI